MPIDAFKVWVQVDGHTVAVECELCGYRVPCDSFVPGSCAGASGAVTRHLLKEHRRELDEYYRARVGRGKLESGLL